MTVRVALFAWMCMSYIVYVLELAGFGKNLGPDRAPGEWVKERGHGDVAQGLPVGTRDLGDRYTCKFNICKEKVGPMISLVP